MTAMALTRAKITDSGSTDYEFISATGIAQTMGERLDDITRPAVDGVGLRKEGKRPDQFDLLTIVDVESAAEGQTLYASYKALQGTLVTYTDAQALAWAGLAVQHVALIEIGARDTIVGGLTDTPTHLVRCRWTLLPTSIP